jgi:hypothetical protein
LAIELRRAIRGGVGVLRHRFRQASERGLLRTFVVGNLRDVETWLEERKTFPKSVTV